TITAEGESRDLCRKRRRKRPGVEIRDVVDSALPFEQVAKHLPHGMPERGDNTHAGDHDATTHLLPPPDDHGGALAQVGTAQFDSVRPTHLPRRTRMDTNRAGRVRGRVV